MLFVTILSVIIAILCLLMLGFRDASAPQVNININIERREHTEIYQYSLPGEDLPSVRYERGSYRLDLLCGHDGAPAMQCCGRTPTLMIHGPNNMKLLYGALDHIGHKVDRMA